MDITKFLSVIVNALEDVKAQDIRVYDTHEKTSAFERVVVATGTSNRQTRALGRAFRTPCAKPVKRFRALKGPKRANGCSLTAAT